jgi:putative acetyltransferase
MIANTPMNIITDNLTDARVHALLQEHLDSMHENSPPGTVFALDLSGLQAPEVTFWTGWDGDELMGCGALKELDAQHGELKSMRTSSSHLRKGVASAMLGHIIETARSRGYKRLSLETGSAPYFDAAVQMYTATGFVPCGAFAAYDDLPSSRFFTLDLR